LWKNRLYFFEALALASLNFAWRNPGETPMRHAFSLAVIFTCLLSTSAFAGNGNVPQSTLDMLGLADMETVSDQEGMQVRGMSGAAATRGHSLVAGVLIDTGTNSHIVAVDANTASGSLETATSFAAPSVSHATASTMNMSLSVTSPIATFTGSLIGGAGGSASASPY
jgi:hypothetical protein